MRQFCSVLVIAALALGAPVSGASFIPAALAGQQEAIAAIVNEDAISMSDVADRMKLIMVSSGLPNTPEMRDKVRPQVVLALIDEQIKLQEAKKEEVDVTDQEVEGGFATIAQMNKTDPAKFKAMLSNSGIALSTMERQIRSQIAWGKVIQKVLRPQINVSDTDIDDVLSRLKANKGKAEYLLAEIFLPVDNAKEDNDAKQLAAKLTAQMKAGQAPFFRVAQQFSRAAGAAQGGDMGWVQQGQLPQELDEALKTMKQGEIGSPVRSHAGYHILLVREKREISDATLPSREDVMNRIGTQRLERAERRLMLDLKSAAFIENRTATGS